MRKRLSASRRNLIARLLTEQLTYREVAKLTRASRATVAQVANTRAPTVQDPAGVGRLIAEQPARSVYPRPQQEVRPYKCGGCGYNVVLKPCAICLARQARFCTQQRRQRKE